MMKKFINFLKKRKKDKERRLKQYMCFKARNSEICPGDCGYCAWGWKWEDCEDCDWKWRDE